MHIWWYQQRDPATMSTTHCHWRERTHRDRHWIWAHGNLESASNRVRGTVLECLRCSWGQCKSSNVAIVKCWERGWLHGPGNLHELTMTLFMTLLMIKENKQKSKNNSKTPTAGSFKYRPAEIPSMHSLKYTKTQHHDVRAHMENKKSIKESYLGPRSCRFLGANHELKGCDAGTLQTITRMS